MDLFFEDWSKDTHKVKSQNGRDWYSAFNNYASSNNIEKVNMTQRAFTQRAKMNGYLEKEETQDNYGNRYWKLLTG